MSKSQVASTATHRDPLGDSDGIPPPRSARRHPFVWVSSCTLRTCLNAPVVETWTTPDPGVCRIRCGLGITFREDPYGRLHVHSITSGGGADRSRGQAQGGISKIHVGDVLISVGGNDVFGMSMDELSGLCVGVAGSQTVVGIRRPPKYDKFEFTITRCAPRRVCVYA